MISTAWIALSLALLKIAELLPNVVPSSTAGTFEDIEYESSIMTSELIELIRGFATLSIFSVPTHLVATCFGLKGIWKWSFGIFVPTLVFAFWSYYAVSGPCPLGFWGLIEIGSILNACGFLMVNTLCSIPSWLDSKYSQSIGNPDPTQ